LPSLLPLEELPGRGLLVEVVGGRHDGELLVVVSERRGAGCRRASEVIGECEISDEIRETLALVERQAAGPLPTVPARPRTTRARRRDSPTQAQSTPSRIAARSLLESLLDESQLASWHDHGRFEVPVADGTVELGALYDLRYRRSDGAEFSLCVVPRSHTTLPLDDIWTNLLLVLRSDPHEFFRVANYRRFGSTDALRRGPLPRRCADVPAGAGA